MPRARSAPTNLSVDNIDLQRFTTNREPVSDIDLDFSVPIGFASVDFSSQDLDFSENRDSVTPTSAVSEFFYQKRGNSLKFIKIHLI